MRLSFDGYYDSNYEYFPENPGVYCIYKISYDSYGTPKAQQLVYIGQAQRGENGNLKKRIQAHNQDDYQNEYYRDGSPKIIYKYSFADLSNFKPEKIDVAEAALVFRMQPPDNVQLKKVYEKDTVTVYIIGKKQFLAEEAFTLTKGVTREQYFKRRFYD